MLLDTLILLIYYNRYKVKNLFIKLGGDDYMSKASIVVYGADVVCASCVNAPSSKDTYEWLQAILGRKYTDLEFEYTYIDFFKQTENLTDHDLQFIERINEDELFYPLVTINDEYVADGFIQLKHITRFIDEHVAIEQ